eukprot:1155264-Pelagomonas_calceolata.AAC.3
MADLTKSLAAFRSSWPYKVSHLLIAAPWPNSSLPALPQIRSSSNSGTFVEDPEIEDDLIRGKGWVPHHLDLLSIVTFIRPSIAFCCIACITVNACL